MKVLQIDTILNFATPSLLSFDHLHFSSQQNINKMENDKEKNKKEGSHTIYNI